MNERPLDFNTVIYEAIVELRKVVKLANETQPFELIRDITEASQVIYRLLDLQLATTKYFESEAHREALLNNHGSDSVKGTDAKVIRGKHDE